MTELKKATFRIKDNHHDCYGSDIDRIVQIYKDRGYELTRTDARLAWEAFSDSMAAGWLGLGSDDEVFSDTVNHLDLEDE